MTTTGKILLGIGIIAGAALAWKSISDYLQKFSFTIVSYGIPTYSNWILRLPITIQFSNPTKLTINADRVNIDMFIKDGDQYVHVGNVNQPFTIGPGKTKQTVVPVMNLQAVANVITNSWQSIFGSRSITMRTDLTVTYQGITLPTQDYTDKVDLSKTAF